GFAGVAIHGGAKFNLIGTNADGTSDTLERNVISGNQYQGVWIGDTGSESNVVAGNYLGTDYTGTVSIPNGDGIDLAGGAKFNRIGTNGDGTNDAAERNLISGNSNVGVLITGSGADSNVVAGNYIGTDVNGTTRLPNLNGGVNVNSGAKFNRIGTDGSNDAFN